MSKANELTLSWEDDFSHIALEGDGINQDELIKVLIKLQDMFYPLTEDQHFHKEENGLEWYYASYYLK